MEGDEPKIAEMNSFLQRRDLLGLAQFLFQLTPYQFCAYSIACTILSRPGQSMRDKITQAIQIFSPSITEGVSYDHTPASTVVFYILKAVLPTNDLSAYQNELSSTGTVNASNDLATAVNWLFSNDWPDAYTPRYTSLNTDRHLRALRVCRGFHTLLCAINYISHKIIPEQVARQLPDDTVTSTIGGYFNDRNPEADDRELSDGAFVAALNLPFANNIALYQNNFMDCPGEIE